jgi:hypothetical protein
MGNQISNHEVDPKFIEGMKKAQIQSQNEKTKKVREIEEHLNNNPKQANRIIANLILMSNIHFDKNNFIDK